MIYETVEAKWCQKLCKIGSIRSISSIKNRSGLIASATRREPRIKTVARYLQVCELGRDIRDRRGLQQLSKLVVNGLGGSHSEERNGRASTKKTANIGLFPLFFEVRQFLYLESEGIEQKREIDFSIWR